METRIIHCNTEDVLYLTYTEKSNGLEIFLVDSKNVPIARYGFDIEKLKGLKRISYYSNNIKIHFEGITPSTSNEFVPVVD